MNQLRRSASIALLSGLLAVGTAHAALTFSFNFTDTAGTGFNDNSLGATRQSSLISAANMLGSYFTNSATITFDVFSENTADNTLAYAGSSAFGGIGFNRTVVQNKIISGTDANGASADGEIHVNFNPSWGYTDTIAPGSFDFKSTIMHEVIHTLGFSSFISDTGTGGFNNTSGTPDFWATFDQFLTNKTGTDLIKANNGFDTTQLGALTGGTNNGVFFSGPNAMSAFGGRVPIYSPIAYEPGSSGSHTDDGVFTGQNALLMNAVTGDGPGLRTLSATELGILKDLGYSVVPEPATIAGILGLLTLAFTFLVRRRNRV